MQGGAEDKKVGVGNIYIYIRITKGVLRRGWQNRVDWIDGAGESLSFLPNKLVMWGPDESLDAPAPYELL